MKYLIPVLAIFIFTSCTNKKGAEIPISYDMPATSPVPPEKFCFERPEVKGGTATQFELIVEGDSVHGKVDYAASENTPGGDFKGVLYGTTLIIKYKFKSDTGMVTQDQQWNIVKDSLFMASAKQLPDSLKKDRVQVSHSGAFHRVACK